MRGGKLSSHSGRFIICCVLLVTDYAQNMILFLTYREHVYEHVFQEHFSASQPESTARL